MSKKPYSKKQTGYGGHDFSSCRGYSVVLGTCDAAKERETSRELVTLLNDAIEELYPQLFVDHVAKEENEESTNIVSKSSLSISELLKREADVVRQKKHSTQIVFSINTNIKGVAMVKIAKKEVCPVYLLKNIFDRVKKERVPCCRYAVRLIPLQSVFFPEEEEFRLNAQNILSSNFHEIEEPNSDCATLDHSVDEQQIKRPRVEEKIRYQIMFKARNHNILNKEIAFNIVNGVMNIKGRGDFRNPQVVILVEAFKNLCGMSWIENYREYNEFNIRKHQEVFASCEQNNKESESDVNAKEENDVKEETDIKEENDTKEETDVKEESDIKEDCN